MKRIRTDAHRKRKRRRGSGISASDTWGSDGVRRYSMVGTFQTYETDQRTCPSPSIRYLSVVRAYRPMGPLAWSF